MEFPVNLTLSLEALHTIKQALREYAESFKRQNMQDVSDRCHAIKADIEQAIDAWIKS